MTVFLYTIFELEHETIVVELRCYKKPWPGLTTELSKSDSKAAVGEWIA